MKRTHIMIAVFFACILSPNLLFPILKTTADEGTGENRSLAAFPTLSLETIDTFPSGVEGWINDHAAFRNRFLSLNARLNLSLFQFIADLLPVYEVLAVEQRHSGIIREA